MRLAHWLGLSVLALAPAAADTPFSPQVHRFVRTYCVECHGAEKQKGDRAFHELTSGADGARVIDLKDETRKHLLADILDQLNLGEMPPKKRGGKQPSASEIAAVTKWITETLLAVEQADHSAHTVLRRLNRREYRHTMEDLFGLHDLTFDPTAAFPADDNEEGFTNIGEALTWSESHLDQYFAVAEAYLSRGLYFGDPPRAKTIEITPDMWLFPKEEAKTPWTYRLEGDGFVDIGAGEKDLTRRVYMASYPRKFLWQDGVRVPGYYRIRVNAAAINRLDNGYDPRMIPADLSQPMQLGLYVANEESGLTAAGEKHRQRVGLWDLPDGEAKDHVVTVWLDRGAIPFVNWDNGPGPSDWWMRDVLKRFHTDVEFRGKEGAHAWHIKGKDAVPGRLVSHVWRGPRIRIRKFTLTGPLPKTAQSPAQLTFFDGQNDFNAIDLRSSLHKFIRTAFRRPLLPDEIDPYLAIYRQALQQGRSRKDALRLALKAVLVSPDFLYLKETGNRQGQLRPHELASRLSYFLRSSLPDAELFASAKSGAIRQPDELRKQAERLTLHENAGGFIEGFGESWLRLDKLGAMPPDSTKFREYYDQDFANAFREETRLFLWHMLRDNRPIREFLASDYTFANEALAEHYGIDGVEGVRFRKVALRPEHRRGGLLGQGSIQTLTANGVDTSPVVRGVWVLENILGTPPSQPPPDVEPLDADIRGAKTIRQRLEKHRTVETCADCHAKIDPWGFPLEFYNPIGGYRPNYLRNRFWRSQPRELREFPGPKVDGRAELATGEKVANLAELQQLLMMREEQFKRALVEKLLVYATGHKMTFRDRAPIEAIVNSKTKGFRDLVLAVVQSPVFRRR